MGSEDILAGLHSFEALFEGWDVVLSLGLELGWGWGKG